MSPGEERIVSTVVSFFPGGLPKSTQYNPRHRGIQTDVQLFPAFLLAPLSYAAGHAVIRYRFAGELDGN
jgi:hypothetical protein